VIPNTAAPRSVDPRGNPFSLYGSCAHVKVTKFKLMDACATLIRKVVFPYQCSGSIFFPWRPL
jgi:hypothetical protein